MSPWVRTVLTLAAALAVALPAGAVCGAPFLISSVSGESYSYVITPGVDPSTGLYGSSSISPSIDGFFWAVGAGNALPGVGADNGTFPATNWFYTYPNYPALLLTTWAANTAIDTCIDATGPLGARCMAMVLTDVNPQTHLAQFALISQPDDPASGDFYFVRPGDLPYQLAPMARLRILASSRVDGTNIVIVLGGPSEAALLTAAYLSEAPACVVGLGKNTDPFNGLIAGYRIFRLTRPNGSGPPTDFRREAWEDLGFPPVPLDAPSNVVTNCAGDPENLEHYFAYTLVFDGGFETPFVSMPTIRIECGPNLADPEPRDRSRPSSRQAPRTRSR